MFSDVQDAGLVRIQIFGVAMPFKMLYSSAGIGLPTNCFHPKLVDPSAGICLPTECW